MDDNLKQRARYLRRNMTDAEQLLWQSLRHRQLKGFKFRRQVVVGHYIADFVCLQAKLVIEVDGDSTVIIKIMTGRERNICNNRASRCFGSGIMKC